MCASEGTLLLEYTHRIVRSRQNGSAFGTERRFHSSQSIKKQPLCKGCFFMSYRLLMNASMVSTNQVRAARSSQWKLWLPP